MQTRLNNLKCLGLLLLQELEERDTEKRVIEIGPGQEVGLLLINTFKEIALAEAEVALLEAREEVRDSKHKQSYYQ
jgi:hypothetical protein